MVTKSTTEGEERRSSDADVKARILVAATVLFGERDFPGTSVRDIARKVGILPGSLYVYVKSKEAILYEIVDHGVGEFVDVVERIPKGPADERLRQAIVDHVVLVARNPEKVLVVFHQWRYLGEENRRRVIASRKKYERFYRDVLHDGISSGVFSRDLDVHYAVLSILGALNWVPEWLAQGDPAAEDYANKMAEVLLQGLRSDRN